MPTDPNDPINPAHYGLILNGKEIECMDVIEALNLGFALGNALKYAWRLGRKQPKKRTVLEKTIEDCGKSHWYLERWHRDPHSVHAPQRVQHRLLAGMLRDVIADAKSEAQIQIVIDVRPYMLKIIEVFGLEAQLCKPS